METENLKPQIDFYSSSFQVNVADAVVGRSWMEDGYHAEIVEVSHVKPEGDEFPICRVDYTKGEVVAHTTSKSEIEEIREAITDKALGPEFGESIVKGLRLKAHSRRFKQAAERAGEGQ